LLTQTAIFKAYRLNIYAALVTDDAATTEIAAPMVHVGVS